MTLTCKSVAWVGLSASADRASCHGKLGKSEPIFMFCDFVTSVKEALNEQAVRVATQCLRPLQVDNIFAFIRYVAVLFRHNNIFTRWLFKTSATS